MKIVEGFILRKVGKDQVVVAIGKASALLNGLIKLNDSGVVLWKLLADGADEGRLVQALQKEYGIPQQVAQQDVASFLQTLRSVGCIED